MANKVYENNYSSLVTREDIARTRNNLGGVRESVTPILLEKNSTG